MSIVSTYDVDNSAALAKRFAMLAEGYLDNPSAGKSESARVALENIFRMLEMFKYDAFADENRRGVLALGNSEFKSRRDLNDVNWHTNIECALKEAFKLNYADLDKVEAVEKLQENLRRLALGKENSPEELKRAKSFFNTFQGRVA